MKKVLIVTYYWPPSGGGGVQRWVKFVKYLRNFGWEPVIFTPENAEVPSLDNSLIKDVPKDIELIQNRIWEPYSFYKKFTGKKKSDSIQTGFLSEKRNKSGLLESISVWIRGNLFIPDARVFWIKPSVKLLTRYLRNNKVDAIVTTGPPHSAHMIGLGLKKKLNIPWLADFRDPWTNIDYYKDLKISKRADKIHHKLEKEVLEAADVVTVISPGMKREFDGIVPKNYLVIPNGYDSDDVKKTISRNDSNLKFSLTHIGSLTKPRNPESLWVVLKELVSEDPDFASALEIHNIGKLDINVVDSLKSFQLDKYLRQTSYLSHDKVIAEQQEATLLLLLVNDAPNAKLILTGKIFEYLVSGTPIICIAPLDGDAAAVIKDTSCGTAYGFGESVKLKEDIYQSFKLFKQNKLISKCTNIEKYDRKRLTKEMGAALDAMTKSKLQ